MTATTIDYTNTYSQPSINIFSIVDTRTNIADPRDATGARKFVYTNDPLEKAFDFSGEPYIVVPDGVMDFPNTKLADAKTESLTFTQNIIVRTKKDGSSGSRTDAGITDMRTIVNSIIKTFKDKTIKGTLRTYNMWDVDLSVTNVEDVEIDQDVLFETTIELDFKTMIEVTA